MIGRLIARTYVFASTNSNCASILCFRATVNFRSARSSLDGVFSSTGAMARFFVAAGVWKAFTTVLVSFATDCAGGVFLFFAAGATSVGVASFFAAAPFESLSTPAPLRLTRAPISRCSIAFFLAMGLFSFSATSTTSIAVVCTEFDPRVVLALVRVGFFSVGVAATSSKVLDKTIGVTAAALEERSRLFVPVVFVTVVALARFVSFSRVVFSRGFVRAFAPPPPSLASSPRSASVRSNVFISIFCPLPIAFATRAATPSATTSEKSRSADGPGACRPTSGSHAHGARLASSFSTLDRRFPRVVDVELESIVARVVVVARGAGVRGVPSLVASRVVARPFASRVVASAGVIAELSAIARASCCRSVSLDILRSSSCAASFALKCANASSASSRAFEFERARRQSSDDH